MCARDGSDVSPEFTPVSELAEAIGMPFMSEEQILRFLVKDFCLNDDLSFPELFIYEGDFREVEVESIDESGSVSRTRSIEVRTEFIDDIRNEVVKILTVGRSCECDASCLACQLQSL